MTRQEALLDRIQKEFPELSWKKYKYVDRGWDHEVIILDDKLVFRFPNSPEYLKVLEDEVTLLEFLGPKVKINIPQYRYVASDHSFAGYKLIKGAELAESVFRELSDQERASLAEQLGGFFTALHTVDVGELGKYHIAREKPFEYELKSLSEKHLKPNLDGEEYQKVESVIAEFEGLDTESLPQVLTHSDLSPNHIIWNSEDQSVGVIDFSDRCIADPAIDFAELYSYTPEFVEQIYGLYQGPKDSEFLNRAKAYQRRVGVFMLVDSFRNQRMSYENAKQVFDKATEF